jgi:predicted enzyme related to lactoylglutathione lyase
MTEIASLVLYAAEPERTATFYRAAGIALVDEDHGGGPVHAAAELGGVHVAVYPAESPDRAPAQRRGGSSFHGFYVDSLDVTGAELGRLGAPVLSGHEEMPWGCRIVVEDPDGRAVEVNQRDHCPVRP